MSAKSPTRSLPEIRRALFVRVPHSARATLDAFERQMMRADLVLIDADHPRLSRVVGVMVAGRPVYLTEPERIARGTRARTAEPTGLAQ